MVSVFDLSVSKWEVMSRIGRPSNSETKASWPKALALAFLLPVCAFADIFVNAGPDANLQLPYGTAGVSLSLIGEVSSTTSLIKQVLWTSSPERGVVISDPDLEKEATATFSAVGKFTIYLMGETQGSPGGNDSEVGLDSLIVTVDQPAYIVTQPQDSRIFVGSTARFSVTAAGSPSAFAYQWHRNGTPITGAIQAAYTTPIATFADSNTQYRVSVNNGIGQAVMSQSATLHVSWIPPAITVQPHDSVITLEKSVTFSVQATGSAPLSYQWYRNDTLITTAGANLPAYTVTPPSLTWNGFTFACRVTNAGGQSVMSNAARLTVNSPPKAPVFTNTNWETFGTLGQTFAGYTLAATGTGNITYGLSPVPSGLSLNPSTGVISGTPLVGGIFQTTASATNQAGPTTHVLTINIQFPPSFTTSPASLTRSVGDSARFTVVATGNPAPTFQWYFRDVALLGETGTAYTRRNLVLADNGALVTAVATNGIGNPVTSAAGLLTVNALNTLPVVTDPNSAIVNAGGSASFSVSTTGFPKPTVRWQRNRIDIVGAGDSTYTRLADTADNGARFRAIATNAVGSDTSAEAILTVRFAPAITVPPRNISVADGQAATFSVTARGNPVPTYQWSRNNIAIPNATASTYTTGVLNLSNSGDVYSVQISNTISPAANASATLTVTPTLPVFTSGRTLTATAGTAINFRVTATGSPTITFAAVNPPTWFLLNANGTLTGTPQTTGQFRVPIRATNGAGTTTDTLTVNVGAAPTAPIFNVNLSVTDTVGTPFNFRLTASGTSPFIFNSGTLPNGLQLDTNTGAITGTPTAAATYSTQVRVRNSVGSDTKTLTITITPMPRAPTFMVDLPSDTLLKAKQTLVLSVSVTATTYPAASYQWQYTNAAGVTMPVGTNSPTYRIDSVTQSASGRYRVIASNGVNPSATSKTCTVTVKPAPVRPTFTVQPTASQTVTVGDSVKFSVVASATPPIAYLWKKNYVDIPNATTATLTLRSVQLSDSGSYRCMISGSDVDWSDNTTYTFSNEARLTIQLPKIDLPKTNIPDTTFSSRLLVTLRTDTAGTTIRYTLNNANLTAQSDIFDPTRPLAIDSTTTLRARAYKNGLTTSEMLTRNYTYAAPGKVGLTLPLPTDSSFQGTLKVTLSATPTDAQIWYTKNGDEPTLNGPTSSLYDPLVGIVIGGTTTIRARAFKTNLTPSDLVMRRYVLSQLKPKVAALLPKPARLRFTDSLKVELTTTTDSVRIWYTLDGSSPFTSNTRKQVFGLVVVDRTLTLKAFAERDNWLPSDSLVLNYVKAPSILVTPEGDVDFDTNVTVILEAIPAGTPIYCTFDGSQPLDELLQPASSSLKYQSPLYFTQQTTLRCVAMGSNQVPSDTLLRFYNWTPEGANLLAPVAEPTGRVFRDIQKVALRGSRKNVAIFYTLNGEIPDPLASPRYADTLRIDSTTTLRAIATLPGYANSPIMTETYTLIPDTPKAVPKGGIYVGDPKVVLKNSSSKVKLYYTLNGGIPIPGSADEFLPGDTISITSSSTLKAIAVVGNLASSVLVENYSVINATSSVLYPGTTYQILGSPLSVVHSGEPDVPVVIRLFSPDSLPLKGFGDVSFGMEISPTLTSGNTVSGFPAIQFNKPADEKRSLYRLGNDGKVYYVSNADSIFILEPGVYFLGHDQQKPSVTFLGDEFVAGDSTQIRFSIVDNVTNLLYDFSRSDAPKAGITQGPVMSPGELKFRLKAPPGDLKSLTATLSVSDGTYIVRVPEEANQRLLLAQKFTSAQSGKAIRLGLKSARSWDLVSLPVMPTTPLTLGEFWKVNATSSRKTMTYDPGRLFMKLMDDTVFVPGQGYWMASDPALNQIQLPPLQTQSPIKGEILITVKSGWNLVGTPIPQKMYWPFPRNLGSSHTEAFVNAPWGFDPVTNEYVRSDSLEPWRGYWVYSYANTVVKLHQSPVSSTVGLAKAGSEAFVSLSIKTSQGSTVEIGARSGVGDGVGVEDEPTIPQSESREILKAVRENRALQSDWIAYKPATLLSWKLLRVPAPEAEKSEEVSISLEQGSWPSGYAAVLVSPRRRVQYTLESNSLIPTSMDAQDTLSVWVAPKAMIQAALKGYTAGPPPFAGSLVHIGDQWGLRLDLPESAGLTWILCNASGRVLMQGHERKAEGRHWLPLETRSAGSGILFLRLEVQGQTLRRGLTYRFATLPR